MINVSELLWLHNMGVPDEQIQALYNKEAPADPAAPAKQEPASAAPAKQEPAAAAAAAAAAKEEPAAAVAAVKQDPTSAALLEVIKSLQAQNAQLAAGKQPEASQSVEDMLLSLI